MSVPPEMMKPQAPMPEGGSPADGAPAAAPMMTPQEPAGQKEGARVNVLMAVKILERALADFGATTEEGQAVLSAIKGLAKKFGATQDKSEELMPAEMGIIQQALAGPGQAGGPPGAPPPGGAPPMPPGATPPA